MNLKDYQEMTSIKSEANTILEERFSPFLEIYKKKIRFTEYQEGKPLLNSDFGIKEMLVYKEDYNLFQKSIEFYYDEIEISFEKFYSGCGSESMSFNIPADIIIGSDDDYEAYLNRLSKDIEEHNSKEELKYEERIQELENIKKANLKSQELDEYNRLKAKYGDV